MVKKAIKEKPFRYPIKKFMIKNPSILAERGPKTIRPLY